MREPIERFADGQVAATARVVTDGLASYNERSLGSRPHDMTVQTPGQRHENDALQHCHWTISLLKRWLPGTHAGAVRETHLQAYLDEFAFRHNRRKTKGVAASRPASSNGSRGVPDPGNDPHHAAPDHSGLCWLAIFPDGLLDVPTKRLPKNSSCEA